MFVFVASSLSVYGQDILVRKGGDVENVKVVEVTPTEVKYKKTSNLNGPVFVENRSRLICVRYENGETQKFNDRPNGDSISLKEIVGYGRFIVSYSPTRFHNEYDSEWLHGLSIGCLGGFNISTNRRLPFYLEWGGVMNLGLGELFSDYDVQLSVEIPFNLTYRYNLPNTKICISPYLGIHFKTNIIALDNKSNSYFERGANRFQCGMQLGVNLDIDKFYVGVGWNRDFIPYMKGLCSEENVISGGIRVNVGMIL